MCEDIFKIHKIGYDLVSANDFSVTKIFVLMMRKTFFSTNCKEEKPEKTL